MKRWVLVLWCFVALASVKASEARTAGVWEKIFKFGNKLSKESLDYVSDERSLRALRVQFVQNQILRKLRLKERPPKQANPSQIPQPIAAGAMMLQPAAPPNEPHDDFYAKTDQKIIFPDDGELMGLCRDKSLQESTVCFTFKMPRDLQPQDLSSTELWIYKEADPLDSYKQTFVVSEASHWDQSHLYGKTNPVAIHETEVEEGWLKVEVGWPSEHWLEDGEASLMVSCRSCGAAPPTLPVALRDEHRPFLVINTRYNARKRRIRQLECEEGMKTCCRERLYVSFEELGWDDWVLQPRGYDAYFCHGSCNSVADVTLSGSHHNSVIKKLIHRGHHTSRHFEMKSCCTPTMLSPLQLFYMDTNHTVTQKTLPNMVVESCGCM